MYLSKCFNCFIFSKGVFKIFFFSLARVEERATLRHKTVSKKLRFYDQTNTKESEVRRTQNLESQKLRAKVDMNKDQGNIFRVIDI